MSTGSKVEDADLRIHRLQIKTGNTQNMTKTCEIAPSFCHVLYYDTIQLTKSNITTYLTDQYQCLQY